MMNAGMPMLGASASMTMPSFGNLSPFDVLSHLCSSPECYVAASFFKNYFLIIFQKESLGPFFFGKLLLINTGGSRLSLPTLYQHR
jgi:hypothetical protein